MMTFDELEKLIAELRDHLSSYQIEEVLGYSFLEMVEIDWSNPDQMNLHSPFRQCSYIASLALSVPQNANTTSLDEKSWKDICTKANTIYDYYAYMHFPKEGDFSSVTLQKQKQGDVAIPSFLLGLCTGIAASSDQVKEDIYALYEPFADAIHSKIGLEVNELLDICSHIETILQSRIDGGVVKAYDCWQAYRNDLDSGVAPDVAVANAKNCMSADIAVNMTKMGSVSFQEIVDQFSSDSATAFMSLFAQARVENTYSADTLFPTEKLSIQFKPLVRINDDDFALITNNHLVAAVQENLLGCVAELGLLEKFNQHKGALLERRALEYLQKIFGGKAKFYVGVYETPTAQNEHDILVLYKNQIIIAECKAKRIRKDFRDIEKAFVRIKADFKDYIQEGYDQARNLEKLILSQMDTSLYRKGGGVAVVINKNRFDHINKIIITHENEGIVATRLTPLLKLDEGDSYPLCIMCQPPFRSPVLEL
jgi:hypothetical protein